MTTMSNMLRRASYQVPRQFRSSSVICPRNPIRFLSSGLPRMTSSTLPPVEPPVSSILPADSYQLLSSADKAGEAEDALYKQQVRDVNEWWSTPRYKGIKRPYSAEDVVSKRGSLQQSYPSSIMARKLFQLLQERAVKGDPVHTSEFDSPPRGHEECLLTVP